MVYLSKVSTGVRFKYRKCLFILYILVFFYILRILLGNNRITTGDRNLLFNVDDYMNTSRNSSHPFISGDTFRLFAKHIYDETKNEILLKVQYGDVIFVKTDFLKDFFSYAYPFINTSFILVTHNSDKYAPDVYRTYLSDLKILKWHTMNPSELNHSKLSPIPIGLMNRRYPHGNVDEILYALRNYRKSWHDRTVLMYINFNIKTNEIERRKALEQSRRIRNILQPERTVSFKEYLQHLGNAKFVLSPPGNGLDCHRTWEALTMGAVPIVLRSTLDPLFENTRTVIIDNWSQLTQEYLLSFNFSKNDDILPDVVNADYWHEQILKI